MTEAPSKHMFEVEHLESFLVTLLVPLILAKLDHEERKIAAQSYPRADTIAQVLGSVCYNFEANTFVSL
jgi:hypothetical protein